MNEKNLLGQTILEYTVEELIGSGGFGTVYKVSKSNVSGSYSRALKHIVIPSQKQYAAVLNSMGGDHGKADDYFANVLKDIVNEIKILSSLSGKNATNIVTYFDNKIVEHKNPTYYDIYILMEYLTPFSDYIEDKEFTVSNVIDLGLDILSALKVCHENDIIHRDVKDDNIFVTADGRYKLGDFGVSKILKENSRAESMKGTPAFIAPEVYLGSETYTNSVDLYSLGIVMYHILNHSRSPFMPPYPNAYEPSDEDAAFAERMKGSIPPAPQRAPEVLAKVLITAILNKDSRYQTVDDFYSDLIEARDNLTPEQLAETLKTVKVNRDQETNNNPPDAKKGYTLTIGETYESVEIHNTSHRSDTPVGNRKNLFGTIGEPIVEPSETSKPDVNSRCEVKFKPKEKKGITPDYKHIRAINEHPIVHEDVRPIEHKDLKWLIYTAPIIIALIGIIVFFMILPNIYGRSVSFIDWLLSNPENIISTLKSPDTILPKIYNIVFLKVTYYIFLISFIVSLFFVGKELQKKEEPNAPGALLHGKEAYFLIMKISALIKEARFTVKGSHIDNLERQVKLIEERLKIERDFGVGNRTVIGIENDIAEQLYYIRENVKKMNKGNADEICKNLELALQRVSELLKQRKDVLRK